MGQEAARGAPRHHDGPLTRATRYSDGDLTRGEITLKAIHSKNGEIRLPAYGAHPELRAISEAQRDTAARAGHPGAIIRDFRRSSMRNLSNEAVPQEVIKKISRHRTDAMLDRYRIVPTDDLATGLERLSAGAAQPARERARR